MIKGKQNKKNINDQKETEQKDYQWSKGNKTQTINDQRETEHKDSQWSISFRSLIIVVFCFLLITDSICVLFPFDHWYSEFVSFWSWSKGNKTQTINDQRETEHKDSQWSKGNRTNRLSMIKRKQNKKTINDQKET
jgi:hypothetical protein